MQPAPTISVGGLGACTTALLFAACGAPHGLVPNEDTPSAPVSAGHPPDAQAAPVMVEIRGAEAIDDTFLNNANSETSWGAYGGVWYGTSFGWRPIVRFDASLVPSGLVLSAAFHFHAGDFYNTGYQRVIAAYRLSDANEWDEASASWSARADGAPWAGADGCSLAGSDYVADNDPPVVNPVQGWNELELPAAWVKAWRDGSVNNGFMLVDETPHSSIGYNNFLSQEAGDNRNYFTVMVQP